MAAPLYVVQQNAKLRIHNRCLQVERAENDKSPPEVLMRTPLMHISQVVLFGNIGLTTPAIDTLLAEGIETVFLTQNGEYRGSLVAGGTPHVLLRRAQYQRLGDASFTLELAKGFIAAKLQHQRTLLQRHNREQSSAETEAAIEQMRQALESLPHKTALSSLRGLEGSASAAYFDGYKRLFASEWRFTRRERRPPPDPVNVLLSFGYTLLVEIARGAVQTVGLDPYAGFLHEYVYNRPALALDLAEEFRPLVDGVVLWACRGGQVRPDDFSPGPAERPVVLNETGKRRFLQAFEQRMEQGYTHPRRGLKLPMRQCLIEQARQIADCLQSGNPAYQGMGFH